MRFSIFVYAGTVTDTARRLCSLQRFGTISFLSLKIAPLNSGPSFLLQTNIVSLRTVPFRIKRKKICEYKKNVFYSFQTSDDLLSLSSDPEIFTFIAPLLALADQVSTFSSTTDEELRSVLKNKPYMAFNKKTFEDLLSVSFGNCLLFSFTSR